MGTFMLIIIILLLLLMVVVFLGAFIGIFLDFIFTVLVVGMPGIFFALAVLYIMKYIYPRIIYRRLRKDKFLAQILSLQLKGDQLEKAVDKKLLREKTKCGPVLFFLITFGVILLYIYYYHLDYPYISTFFKNSFLMSEIQGPDSGLEEAFFFYYSYLEDVTSSVIPAMVGYRSNPDFGLALITSGVTATGIFMFFHPDRILYQTLEKRVIKFTENLKETNLLLINDIRNLEKKMNKIVDTWGCNIQYPYLERIKKYVQKNKEKIITDPRYLQKTIEKEKERAEEDLNRLLACFDSYQKTMNLAKATSRVVNKTGSRSFIKEMDQIYQALDTRLKELISKRLWDDFEEIISGIEKNLRDLKEGAEQFLRSKDRKKKQHSKKQSTGQSDKDKEKQEQKKEEKDVSDENMTREKALSILNLPEDSPRKSVKTIGRELIKRWHPDRYGIKEREMSKKDWSQRYKRVKAAYDYLMKSG